ncbi:MAG: heme-dependent oxidative N-demethylase subunit alpha family protein [Verrucomicrobiota bacterium]
MHPKLNLSEILADKDFGLRMRFEKEDIASFFKPTVSHTEVITERQKWLKNEPETYSALLPDGIDLLDEAIQLAISLGTIPEAQNFADFQPLERCKRLGELWEADFLLMKPDAEGVFRLYGGCLCFPSHWDLHDKLGQPMSAIHAPVPGLNETLGRQIDGFLQRIKPGTSWERANWGLSRSPELNLHPSRKLPRLDPTITLDDVWFRLEQQSLVALPGSGGILFGIKLVIISMHEIKADPTSRQGLMRALQTMPESMAQYKGISTARERLIDLIQRD